MADETQNAAEPTITRDDFEKVLMVVGTITRVEEFSEARRPAYKIWADFWRIRHEEDERTGEEPLHRMECPA